MSAPHFLDPHTSSFPVVEQNEEPNLQLSLSISPHHASPSLSPPTFFNSTPHQPAGLPNAGDSFHHHHQVVDYISQSRLNDHKPPSSSSAIFEDKAPINDSNSELHKKQDGDYYYQGSGEGSSTKWIPSNMGSMQNMINSNIASSLTDKPAVKCTLRFQYHSNNNDRNSSSSSSHNTNSYTNCTIRICSDCNTTTTPLWRSGPKGPKSLCNACGIRQRKARRAMAAAMASGTAVALERSTSKSNKVHSKEIKKLSSGHVSKCKKLCKLPDPPLPQNTKLSFKNLALSLSKNPSVHHPVFPRDVEEAAILLMELSCSFIHA